MCCQLRLLVRTITKLNFNKIKRGKRTRGLVRWHWWNMFLIGKCPTAQLLNFRFLYVYTRRESTCETGWQKHAVRLEIYAVNLVANGLPTTIPNCPDVISIPDSISPVPRRRTHQDKQPTSFGPVIAISIYERVSERVSSFLRCRNCCRRRLR